MNNKIIFNLLIAGMLLFLSQLLTAQTSTCNVDTLIISTGYNHNTNTIYNVGDGDGLWTVTLDQDPLTSEPRPAFVIDAPVPPWHTPFANTKWISSLLQASNSVNGRYDFEYKFCVNNLNNINLKLQVTADDSSGIFLNGNYLGSGMGFNYTVLNTITVTDPSKFRLGSNTITVQVGNTGGGLMGLNVFGVVKAGSGAFVKQSCCQTSGKITGLKWNDADGNGLKDAGEVTLPGWTIQLFNGTSSYTTITDGLGNYYFNVPAGSYTLGEVNQQGWIQTYPVSQTHSINVISNQVIVDKNFGNKAYTIPPPPCPNCIGSFAPEPGDYILSAWVKKETNVPTDLTYTEPQISIDFPSTAFVAGPFVGTGQIIDGWQRIEEKFTIDPTATYINIKLNCLAGNCLFDDIRIFPVNGSMKSYVYDPINLRLVAELDERNYATFYEYDEEGKLTRVKKETEKGIMTIKENKNSSKKK
ncbi:MAG: hypothetical protein H0W84_05205 [Bacteroidetes bacterium]|nr:hypothetical protein [Bacteroidota bacterium]